MISKFKISEQDFLALSQEIMNELNIAYNGSVGSLGLGLPSDFNAITVIDLKCNGEFTSTISDPLILIDSIHWATRSFSGTLIPERIKCLQKFA